MTTVDYGTDLSCLTDLTPLCGETSGMTLFLQSLARRVTTRRGSVIDDANYGLDVRDYLQDELSAEKLAMISSEVGSELIKDERVLTAVCTTTFNQTTKALTLSITGDGSLGPFLLVLSVSSVTVQILKGT